MTRITVKSAAKSADKFVAGATARSTEYAAETKAAGPAWEAGAIAAGPNYLAGIQVAGIQNRFVGGVKKAGAAKFARKVESVGVGRYSPGVNAGKDDYKSGVEPFLSELDGFDPGDRGPRGSPANYELSRKVGEKLHAKRLALLAATS